MCQSNNEMTLGITLGDPAGIGAEVVIKSLDKLEVDENCRILLIGDFCLISALDSDKNIPVYSDINSWKQDSVRVGFLDVNNIGSKQIKYGKMSVEYGEMACSYLGKAVELLKQDEIDRLVTAPVNKDAINSTGLDFIGHTEFLADRFNISKNEVLMMLLSEDVRFILLTRHIPLSQVANIIKKDYLKKTVKILDIKMQEIFKYKEIKIGILGFNPHLGEKGLIGKEEKNIIVPAIKELKKEYSLKGPLSVEKAVECMKEGKIDVALCMYHDQAIIPLKLLYPNRGVNLTLGLPFIRTSPFHGTAYDIAGKNIASCASMYETLKFTIAI